MIVLAREDIKRTDFGRVVAGSRDQFYMDEVTIRGERFRVLIHKAAIDMAENPVKAREVVLRAYLEVMTGEIVRMDISKVSQ